MASSLTKYEVTPGKYWYSRLLWRMIMTNDEMFIWMTNQPESQLLIVFSKWLEAGHRNRYLARALRDLGRKFSNEALLERMERQWVLVEINGGKYSGYVTRDYTLEGWMLSFPDRPNYCFKAQDIISIGQDGVRWSIEFNDSARFGRES